MEISETAVHLIGKAAVLSARWSGRRRLLCLRQAARAPGDMAKLRARLLSLEDRVERLEDENGLLRARLRGLKSRKPYPPAQRLRILWHVEHYGIARRRVSARLVVARATIHRWLRALEDASARARARAAHSSKKLSDELVQLIWEVSSANPQWGRRRIAMTLWALGMFVAASTVRKVLLRGRPGPGRAAAARMRASPAPADTRQIPARYPNQVWSVDRTTVYRWGIWPTYVLVVADHFSRKLIAVTALPGRAAVWILPVLARAFARYGAPKYLISDREAVFTGQPLRQLLGRWGVAQRFGAVGQQGSIAVTERLILTLKQEWLQRVPLIRGHSHLAALLADFGNYYE